MYVYLYMGCNLTWELCPKSVKSVMYTYIYIGSRIECPCKGGI